MSEFDRILAMWVPIIIAHARARARIGDCSPIRLYYKDHAICGQSEACDHPLEKQGWIRSEVLIGPEVPYARYPAVIREAAGYWPIL